MLKLKKILFTLTLGPLFIIATFTIFKPLAQSAGTISDETVFAIMKQGFRASMGFNHSKIISSLKFPEIERQLDAALKEMAQRNLRPSFLYGYSPDFNAGVLLHTQHLKIYRGQAPGAKIAELLNHFQNVLGEWSIPREIVYLNENGFDNYKKCVSCIKIPPLTRLCYRCSLYCTGMATARQKDCQQFVTAQRFAILQWNREHPEKGISFLHPGNRPDVFLYGKNFLDEEEVEDNAMTDPNATELIPMGVGYRRLTSNYNNANNSNHRAKIAGGITNLIQILKQIFTSANEGKAVYFHCKGGFHRTGIVALAIRHIQGGEWIRPFATPIKNIKAKPSKGEEALQEIQHMLRHGLKMIRKDLNNEGITINNPAELEYLLHNPEKARAINLETVRELFARVDVVIPLLNHQKLSAPELSVTSLKIIKDTAATLGITSEQLIQLSLLVKRIRDQL
ncbi:MAG: hypothetical protein HQK53_02345 [Oligoflexia bacterium]|nr:hypothetical protein [Oligoflexia bacterium]